MNIDEIKGKIFRVIRDAGAIALDGYVTLDTAQSYDTFPTTEVDVAISDFLYPKLHEIVPVPILDEERNDDLSRLDSEYIWIVDPIDGTKDYIEGTGEYCVMIALIQGNQPVFSVIYQPSTNRLLYAIKDMGAYELVDNIEKRLHVAEDIENSVASVSRFHNSDKLDAVFQQCGITQKKPTGSMGLKMASIADGSAHICIYLTDQTGEWDSAAGALLVREAGGVVVGLQGEEIVYNKPIPRNSDGLVVVHPSLLDKILLSLRNSK